MLFNQIIIKRGEKGKMFISKVWSKIKQKFSAKKTKKTAIKVVSATVLTCSLLALSASQNVYSSSSTTPRFNFLQGDSEMLKVAKTTDSSWGDPINANIGDRVAFLFYYHNGMVDTTATHTKVRVDLPIDESNKLIAKSWLWSQETEAISDTIVDGKIVGQSGATVNLPSNGRIQYVAGSTKWYPNKSQVGTQMPDGITSNSGLDLGSIKGCWEYSGYVTFLADIKGQAQLVMDKTVAHPGDTEWKKEISANPGDSVAYHLGIKNTGDITAQNVSVTDQLPTYMTYTTGTAFYYTKDHPEGVKLADTIFGGGVNLPSIAPGDSGITYITYRTKIATNMPNGAFSLNNVAKVFMNSVEQDQDQAKVTVICDRGLVIDKKVSNGISWVEQNSLKLGDRVDYRIVIRNTGNMTVENIRVKDVLPMFVSYISGSTKLNGDTISDGIVSADGVLVGSLASGGELTITLSGKTYGCPPIGDYTVVNSAYASGSGALEVSDTARSILSFISASAPTVPLIK